MANDSRKSDEDDDDGGRYFGLPRPLDAEEISSLRTLLRKTDPEKLADMQQEWERYKWLWGLIIWTGGWAAAVITFVWAFKDQIIRGIRAASHNP